MALLAGPATKQTLVKIIMEPFSIKDDIQHFFLDLRIILLAGRINTETVTSSVLKNLRTGADETFVLRFVKGVVFCQSPGPFNILLE